MLVNAALNVVLVRVLGFRGLALGTSIAALFNAATLLLSSCATICTASTTAASSARSRGSRPPPVRWGSSPLLLNQMLEARWPGGALVLQIVRLSITIGVSLVVLGSRRRGCSASASSTTEWRSWHAGSADDRR